METTHAQHPRALSVAPIASPASNSSPPAAGNAPDHAAARATAQREIAAKASPKQLTARRQCSSTESAAL